MSNTNIVAMQDKADERQLDQRKLISIEELAAMNNQAVSTIRAQLARFKMAPIIESKQIGQGRIAAQYDLEQYTTKAAAAAELLLSKDIKAATKLVENTKTGVLCESVQQLIGQFRIDKDEDSIDAMLTFVVKAKVGLYKDKIEALEKALAEQTVIAKLKTEQLDEDREWLSIKRVAVLNKTDWHSYNWRLLKKVSEDNGYEVHKIFDANYGQVNVYRYEAWELAYPGVKTM